MKGTFGAALEHISEVLLTEGVMQRAHLKGLELQD